MIETPSLSERLKNQPIITNDDSTSIEPIATEEELLNPQGFNVSSSSSVSASDKKLLEQVRKKEKEENKKLIDEFKTTYNEIYNEILTDVENQLKYKKLARSLKNKAFVIRQVSSALELGQKITKKDVEKIIEDNENQLESKRTQELRKLESGKKMK
jgi:flagellar biosynthesis component FlhA